MSLYKQKIKLRSADVGETRHLRLSVLYTFLQEAAIAHTEKLGAGREKTLDRGFLWIVTQQYAEISRMPEYDETIELLSWPGKTMHVFFPRYFEIRDAEGNAIIKASSLWALIDEKTRRVIFPEEYGIRVRGRETGAEVPLPRAFKMPEAEKRVRFTVPESYIDLNGHMNNTRYYDLLLDTMPEAYRGRDFLRITSEYTGEARKRERLTLSYGEKDGDLYLLGEGKKKVFRMKISFSEEETEDV